MTAHTAADVAVVVVGLACVLVVAAVVPARAFDLLHDFVLYGYSVRDALQISSSLYDAWRCLSWVLR